MGSVDLHSLACEVRKTCPYRTELERRFPLQTKETKISTHDAARHCNICPFRC